MSNAERHAYDEHVNAIMIQNDVLGNAKFEGHEEGRAEGLAEGLEKGIEKGRTEEKHDIARKMLSYGITAEQVAQITGLQKKQIEQLQN